MASLPPSAASCVCSFLSGLDALSLSHCSSFWLQQLNVSPYWQSLLPSMPDPLHASAYKALYLRSRSLAFTGDSYAFIDRVPYMKGKSVQLSRLRSRNLSFDIWFALLAQDPDGSSIGGILYGLQSQRPESRVWPKFHQQFVVVSATGDLFCSVIDYRPVVASNLRSGRWYHLALTYDHQNQRQDVYLGGEKLRSDTGTLHKELDFLEYEQVGTGCITANGLHFPKPGYLGWYGFHGLVDEFRVWGGVLTEVDVGKLAGGETLEEQTLLGTLKVSGRPPLGSRWNVREVWCSKPLESRQLEMNKSSWRKVVIVRPEQLPADVIKTLCSFLTGFDAFHLSHTNYWWLQYLSDGLLWKKCLPELTGNENQVPAASAWKERYMLSRSMLFTGLQVDGGHRVESYAYFAYGGRDQQRPLHFRLNFLGSESFSFDVWFSLLPASDGKAFGGIIYGLQSGSRESRGWPHYHQQFVMVSSTGDLHCSVLASRPVVASNLESNRWYHLALTYDNEHHRQEVYLDGVSVHSSTGAVHPEWGFFTHEQVGTGFITAGKLNFPRPEYIGWYGFHGIIDDFSIWSGVISQDDVTTLAHGGTLPNVRMRASVKVDTARERMMHLTWRVNVQLKMCTRPAEGKAMQQAQYHSPSQEKCVIS
ncbi:uncharacterized protein KRP23_14121 [Phytophthora ramorum]|uniref:uncharacterized protein n=1 Tax=Phytophthora ramorum TaxID=164328 RepID=UPI0030B726BB|nr:hypothetical protein KRP23_14121 [Phytophthora ramorum]